MSEETTTREGEMPGEGEGEERSAEGQTVQSLEGSGDEAEPIDEEMGDGDSSGAGDSEGAKEVREAEQKAAMGKLSELFGQRQEDLTGDVLVEGYSEEQQRLRTAVLGTPPLPTRKLEARSAATRSR